MQLKQTGESIDGLFRNKVRVIQAKRGYRVSEDAIILAWFVRPGPRAVILDAGTGCGVIAFGLAVKHASVDVVGLEIQKDLADRARRGVMLNNLENRVAIVRGDLRQADGFFLGHSFDAIVSNPPYHEPGKGRISFQNEKALSRHQLMMPLHDLFRVASTILRPGGSLSIIYPASGLETIQTAMKESGFKPSRMLWIHPRQGVEAGLLCVEAKSGPEYPTLKEDCLYVYQGPGQRTREAEAILAGEDIPDFTGEIRCRPR